MPAHGNLLILIADGEHARFVRPGVGNIMHTIWLVDSAVAHLKSKDLRSDGPGASYHSNSTAHHAFAPRHDPHRLEQESFARFVAQEVNALPDESYDSLLVVAPARSLNIIVAGLNVVQKAKVIATLDKDLVKTPDHELWPHLETFVPPAAPPRYI
ncbi:host attachment protein [Acidocella sp.]|uniref:host attachment protein n=1 Tax=Acidocella sp. TaxID=50710 RepID=UPI002633D2C9|nr:host attachment protein [Acidocella sp.]